MSEEKNEKGNNAEVKPTRRSMIGGQALMEGVMMRGERSMAMAVRDPSGEILVETKRLGGKKWYNKVPIIRGVASFISSLVSGVNTLMRSADVSSPEEEKPGKGWMAFAVILGVVLAVGLFILLPGWVDDLLFGKLFGKWGLNLSERMNYSVALLVESLFEGVMRIIIFVLYLLIVSRMKDIRRTFMYHGAEHRTINCYEKGYEMTVENVQKCSTRHNRCGTTFLFFVMTVSILVFALVRWLLGYIPLGEDTTWADNRLILTAARLIMLPIVAGLSYELLRGLALLPDNGFTNFLRAPGLALQRLTTYPPDDEMAEVALVSFLTVLNMDADESIRELQFGEYDLKTVRKETNKALSDYGLDEREASAETDWLLSCVTKLKRSDLGRMKSLDLGQYRELKELLSRRLTGEPLDYVLGESEFFGNKLKVNKSVLVPRMETEILCDEAVKIIGDGELKVLDLCTGSGCIALSIAKATKAKVVAADVSDDALKVAKKNLEGTDAQVVKSDLFESVEGEFDIIVSNPPYIASAEIYTLAPEVKAQPHIALDGGEDGLDFYRRIEKDYRSHLRSGGVMLLEIGYDQADKVREIFKSASVEIKKDLDGNDRVAVIK